MATTQGEVVWTALQNAAVNSWNANHGRYGRYCDPLRHRNERQSDGNVVCECEQCESGAVIGRDGSLLLTWHDGVRN